MTSIVPVQTRDVLQAFKEGQSGWPVAVYQLNLHNANHPSLPVDGVFGPLTRTATIHFQRDHGLFQDGIAGPATCTFLCLRLTSRSQMLYATPMGLAKGILEGESGFDPACVSMVYGNGTCDLGAWQDNQPVSLDGDDRIWLSNMQAGISFDIELMARATLDKIRTKHDSYVTLGCANSVAWQLATLYHNRPADADRLARASVRLVAIDWSVLSDTPGWFTIGGISYSQRTWDQKYVANKTRYVVDWTP